MSAINEFIAYILAMDILNICGVSHPYLNTVEGPRVTEADLNPSGEYPETMRPY
ncbi:MAG: hypothetical protein KKE73_10880 [Proteobacteria bacterium]|nr:hypothetical protein [Pseudomonadota bacterium]